MQYNTVFFPLKKEKEKCVFKSLFREWLFDMLDTQIEIFIK